MVCFPILRVNRQSGRKPRERIIALRSSRTSSETGAVFEGLCLGEQKRKASLDSPIMAEDLGQPVHAGNRGGEQAKKADL